jgi:hypothetical protein
MTGQARFLICVCIFAGVLSGSIEAARQKAGASPRATRPGDGRVKGSLIDKRSGLQSGKREGGDGPCGYAVVFVHRITIVDSQTFSIVRTVAVLSDGYGRFDVAGVEPGQYLIGQERKPYMARPLRVAPGRTLDVGAIDYSGNCQVFQQLPYREELNLQRSPVTLQ